MIITKDPKKTVRSEPAASRRGFTLLELLISITLLAVIAGIVSGAMRLGWRSLEKGEQRIESLERFKSSISILVAQIESGIPLSFTEEGSTKTYFDGDRDRLSLSTNYSIWGGQAGYVVVSYRVEQDQYGKQTLYATENTIGIEKEAEAKLFDGFDEIYFEYYYKGPTDEEGQWTEVWTDETTVPERIRINLARGKQTLVLTMPMKTRRALAQAR